VLQTGWQIARHANANMTSDTLAIILGGGRARACSAHRHPLEAGRAHRGKYR
jgi:hypothetical protein